MKEVLNMIEWKKGASEDYIYLMGQSGGQSELMLLWEARYLVRRVADRSGAPSLLRTSQRWSYGNG